MPLAGIVLAELLGPLGTREGRPGAAGQIAEGSETWSG